jgi:two-component system LytT family response regulator
MPTIKTILIDDEPAARRLLRSMLTEHSRWIDIIAEATNGKEAIELINEHTPNLIFLDIQMPDYNGFEVLDRIHHQPNIIFTTAYEEYAIKAFETFSIDYLLKPIREDRLLQSLQKLKAFGKLTLPDRNDLKTIIEELKSARAATAFPVKQGDKILLFSFEKISHFEADDKYVFLHTIEGEKFLLNHTLSVLELKLPSNFLRVQKSYIINKDQIKEIHKHFNGRYLMLMRDKDASRILTGLSFYEKIKASFGL